MEATPLPWLDAATGTITTVAIALFVVVNGLFGALLFLRRDRRFVNRWTKPVLVADAALFLAAFGTPVVAIAIKLAAKGVTTVGTTALRLLPGK